MQPLFECFGDLDCSGFRCRNAAILLAMANVGALGSLTGMLKHVALPILLGLCLMRVINAQDGTTPYKIHVTTSLFQIPTLVLSNSRNPLPPIAPERFRIRIDGGKPILPSRVRLEGDDPISLGVLVDLSGDENPILSELPAAFSALQTSLRPQDRIYLYAVDCVFIRNPHPIGGNVANFGPAVQALIDSPLIHGHNRNRSSCSYSVHFMDALATVVNGMGQLPGRRVLLAIANGYDSGSRLSPGDVNFLAARYAVAISALSVAGYEFPVEARVFPPLCERSGGIALRTKPGFVTRDLQMFLDLIRGRYIVEFQRSKDLTDGQHSIKIEIAKMSAFIRPAGTSALLREPEHLDELKHTPEDQPPAPNPTAQPQL